MNPTHTRTSDQPRPDSPPFGEPPTRSYRVRWEIDVEASSPADAARQALAAQRRPGSTTTVFDVEWTDTLGDAAGTEVTSRVQVEADQDPGHRPAAPAGTMANGPARTRVRLPDETTGTVVAG